VQLVWAIVRMLRERAPVLGPQVEGRDGAVAAAAEAVADGREADFEAQLATKAGERLWVQVQLRPVRHGGSASAENLVRPMRPWWARVFGGASGRAGAQPYTTTKQGACLLQGGVVGGAGSRASAR
jgi:hypothetical protein